MSEVKFDLELDKDLSGTIAVQCPRCHSKHRVRLKDAVPNKEFLFPCGFSVAFSGDSLQDMQKSLTKLHRTMKKLGKR